ncbi:MULTISPECIES: FMN-dependent NADH-azoreductase [Pseudomonas]|uniref:FMN dependent NADH:quinone oxidoreductase n=1 Tax=Pseudomonas cichorii TaxID=36746 RepID=A0A3M4W9D5_PSECI|nr:MULTISPECIES: NAD(P)H-dependent oxidoreductase [Pseudomonas]AHF67052.1 acyl carrier protein phosphodiesterase [Pseudomonas cichorii JBC1]QVE18931.1 NAD(P)H-dependent oxidoreductase [Pseudomonas cichorii]RMR60654.1 FMN-dependent proteinH-azoreductase [Pseudomonas cichorii]SDN61852.1 FMN-dependent NADH-azoreductase [Pseudomonas cichorii]GFM90660.1 FMN-dependent NADH-azoreductase [Pseudomonas cichorii]
MNILHLDSSILGAHSVSRALSTQIVAKLQSETPNAVVTYRDLAATPVPHLSAAYLTALQATGVDHSPEIQRDLEIGAATLQEFQAADTIVIGVAFYNFTVPTQLKAWIDRVLVAGQTFRYTEQGPEGLAGGKRVILAVARGGNYGPDSPIASMEHGETYLRTALNFIGITNPEVILAEGVAFGPDQRAAAISAAEQRIAELSV